MAIEGIQARYNEIFMRLEALEQFFGLSEKVGRTFAWH